MMSRTRFSGLVVTMFSLLAQISCAEKPADEGADGSLSAAAGSKGSSYVNGMKLKACSPAEIDSFLINTAIVEDRSGIAPLMPSQAKDFVQCMRTRDFWTEYEKAEGRPSKTTPGWLQFVRKMFGLSSEEPRSSWPASPDGRFGTGSAIISRCQEDARIQVGSVSERWAEAVLSASGGDVKCLSGRLGKGARLIDSGFGAESSTYFIHVRDPAPGASLNVTVKGHSAVYVFNPAPGAKVSGTGEFHGDGFTLFQQPPQK